MTFTPVLWLLAFVPALVALYFLKLRRQNLVVSSTLLWKRTVEDLHVNAPFQRLRRNLLLLLQLLILAGLILSAWRPRLAGIQARGRHLIVLVDNSASMAASEEYGTRLELAKREARELVRGMGEGDRMVLLAFASKTSTIEPLTGDRTLLEARIQAIQQSALPTDLAQALKVAASVAETLPAAEIHVLGDGCYGDMSAAPAEIKGHNIRLAGKGSSLENVAITEMDVRRSFEEEEKTEVFALIENFGERSWSGTCSLYVDEVLKDAKEVSLPPGKGISIVFEIERTGEAMARLKIDAVDALPADNEAFARIAEPRVVSIAVAGKPNPWIDLALRADAGVKHRRLLPGEVARISEVKSPEEFLDKFGAEVVIFDGEPPASLPPVPGIYIGCLPPLAQVSPATLREHLAAARREKFPAVVDWERTHPVNRFLVYTDIVIEESLVFPRDGAYRSLVDSEVGSVIGVLEIPSPGRRPVPLLIIGFDILKTNWPLGHYSFPIFFANAIAWLGGEASGAGQTRWRTGEPLVYHPPRGDAGESFEEATFRTPSGREIQALREESGALLLSSADEAGVYSLHVDGKERARFPVALLNARESHLVPAEEIDFGDFSVQLKTSLEDHPLDLWKWLALGVLAMLLLEWYVYNRRLLG